MEIANTIATQIGNKALFMIGAKQLAAGSNYLQFKIGRNAKNINMIRVTLDHGTDTYTLDFMKVRKFEHKIMSTYDGVYSDSLCKFIESETGLYTSL